ncbi:hypothetical protein BJY01DRAFT_160731 [Aspergillus pseudoustus]|uniref:Fungal-specific transcription factor domain-containing protein n=1 Tax=Aspergillus pseudoustus TaxID=1810923 RepID=A0ABR4K756_9EURO
MTPTLPDNSDANWVFITTSPSHRRPTKTQRSQARRRVMREIGYARRKAHAHSWPEGSSETHMVARDTISKISSVITPAISPSIALDPLALDRESRWLLHHIFLDADSCQSRIYRDRWFPICFTNSAVFDQMLATYASHIVQNQPDHDLRQFILSSHAKALARVRTSLKSLAVPDEQTLNGLVCAIAALACYSHLEGDVVSWKFHMAAVSRLIAESGFAMDELDARVIDVVQWVESIGSYAFDICPGLGNLKAGKPYQISPPEASSPCLGGTDLPVSLLSALRALQETNQQLSMRQLLFGHAIWQEPMEIDQLIHPLTYRFLLLGHSTQTVDPLHICLRSGALLYLAEFRRKSGVSPVVTGIHIQRLRSSMEAMGQRSGITKLTLWLLTLGAMEATTQWDQQYFYSRLLGLLQASGVDSVPLWTQYLTEVVWIGGLFQDTLLMIWAALHHSDAITVNRRPPTGEQLRGLPRDQKG